MNFNIYHMVHSRITLSNRYGMTWLMILIVIANIGCKKFVEIDTPPDKISQENVYSNDQTATAVLNGLYITLSGFGADIAKYGGLLADEFDLWSGADHTLQGYYSNTMISNETTTVGNQLWGQCFKSLFNCNSAIEGLNASQSLSPAVQKQLLGEVYFLRAWLYFYLVNFYGDLPLIVSTDPEKNRLLPRSSTTAVYSLIKDDLRKAKQLLSTAYVNGQLNPYSSNSVERVRPTSWAASAMLARVYLFTGEWVNAEAEASIVINNTSQFEIVNNLDGVFLKNGREAIWQMQPTSLGFNTLEGQTFHLTSAPAGLNSVKSVFFSNFLMAAFESNDKRKTLWVDSFISGGVTYYFPSKYKIGAQNSGVTTPAQMTEYTMVLRLGEQYLVRAEARLRQNNISAAIADIDVIRQRANLPLIAITNPGISQTNLLTKIFHERQVELFAEWGNRWFDLKRTGEINIVMQTVTPTKGGSWESADQLLPIPYNDLLFSPNLKQNTGY